ncbi:bifunctional coenzyme A synthase-like isoform X2 [Coturnix japonica]|uniref:Bifunctional coenzyme A synthase n=1 Tax=Coturnix japonica TaxID=93934 RepID=A0A8C2SX16_COTJA|nr:bifunctional coenzyme A synthase-like isoform X2 [Coturnix japonica]XP_015741519.1 bifunctional coenzyme A synthase-like isoform X2 [Coturnix japonica]
MAPFPSGLLVLTAPLGSLPRRAAAALAEAAGLVTGPLYVHLQPGLRLDGPAPRPAAPPRAPALLRALSALYAAAASHRELDVRVLLGHGHRLARPPRVLLADGGAGDAGPVRVALRELAAAAYGCPAELPAVLLSGSDGPEAPHDGPGAELPVYSDVVVGGTFDRLHGAHRLLLSACCLLARRRLLVGVADGELLRHKVLRELIEPYELRVAKLREFLADVQPSVLYDIVPLGDPYGPAITDPELRCIVVSEETRKGGEAVNKKRIENGLAALELFEIELMEDPQHSLSEEEKISSSSLRQRLLGTLLRPPRDSPTLPPRPYIIGLTGGSGSGKTSIARRLGQMGAFIIDADALGHAVYLPGSPAHGQVVAAFGAEILNKDGTINRKILGAKVFGNQERLKNLTDIVWPEIARMVREQIREAGAQGKAVMVLDAAVLLEAGWQEMVHEVWAAIIPEDEALKRIVSRDGLSEEAARDRLRSQMSDGQRVREAHVVLSTAWEPDVTHKQVEKAWELLQRRIHRAATATSS